MRAETVKEPEEAQNSGYGAACGGDVSARRGIDALVSPAFGWQLMEWVVTEGAPLRLRRRSEGDWIDASDWRQSRE